VSGGIEETYEWTGNLAFNETETVALPLQSAGFWLGDDEHKFTVTISEPNGGVDEYINNNVQTSEFDMPDMYDGTVVFRLRTNNRAVENAYQVKDAEGNILVSRSGMYNLNTYIDTLDFGPGCYTIEVFDNDAFNSTVGYTTGNDGLDFWYATAYQGTTTGWARLFSMSGSLLKNFEADFGSEMRYSFVVDNFTNIEDRGITEDLFEIYPNPTRGLVNIDLHFIEATDIELEITDISGRLIENRKISNVIDSNILFDFSREKEGMYFCKIKTSKGVTVKKVIFSK
jgi:hypothetical protein